MPCFHPLEGYRQPSNGQWKGTEPKSETWPRMIIPCGQCKGCRWEKTRQWAIRITNEASLNENNCFITLTYDDKHLPHDLSLHKEHFQLFMKSLREKYYPKKIRYYHCGEYGDENYRPHYHAIIFGHTFPNLYLAPMKQKKDYKLYCSDDLTKLWKRGFHAIGDVNFQTAAYCARYIMKKITGNRAKEHYQRVIYKDSQNYAIGQIVDVLPEYTTMSLKPGIGEKWLKKWYKDIYPSDTIVVNEREQKPPKFYDNLFKEIDPNTFLKIKEKRSDMAQQRAADNTPERLAVKEVCLTSKLNNLKRNL